MYVNMHMYMLNAPVHYVRICVHEFERHEVKQAPTSANDHTKPLLPPQSKNKPATINSQ